MWGYRHRLWGVYRHMARTVPGEKRGTQGFSYLPYTRPEGSREGTQRYPGGGSSHFSTIFVDPLEGGYRMEKTISSARSTISWCRHDQFSTCSCLRLGGLWQYYPVLGFEP